MNTRNAGRGRLVLLAPQSSLRTSQDDSPAVNSEPSGWGSGLSTTLVSTDSVESKKSDSLVTSQQQDNVWREPVK